MSRILAFGCHPDDVEFYCAGTLALLAEQGYEIHIATMTGGEMGSPDLSPQAIREVRIREAGDSAEVIGAQYHYAGGYDIEVEYNSAYRKRAVKVLRDVDPLIVFTTPPMDYLPDHEQTSLLVRNACFVASAANFDCLEPTKPTSSIPYLYYWDAVSLVDIFGRPLPLTCAVDISTAMSTKERMLSCHKSQREWIAHHEGNDNYLEMMRSVAIEEGRRVGFTKAEGFVQHRGYGHPKDNILKSILDDLCVDITLESK